MFGWFASQEKKMREHAGNWLELADKVYHYRRDVLPELEAQQLLVAADYLDHLMLVSRTHYWLMP